MSFAAPLWLAVAAAMALGVVVAHLFSTSVPPRDVLPTVRFVPEGAPLAVLRTRRVSDIALLLLRLLAVALLGLALAGAHVRRDGPRRVVVADMSRAVATIAEVRDSALAAVSGGEAFIAFDSSARRVSRDSLDRITATRGARGSLSAAIFAAHRVMAGFSGGRNGTELVIVSPVAREEIDSATARLLALWDGPIRVARVRAAGAPVAPGWEIRAIGDDPVAAALGGNSPRPSADRRETSALLIVRTLPTRADTLWVRDSGGVVVLWPAMNAGQVLLPRAAADTQEGIATNREVVIGTFARQYRPRDGRVLVRWLDGEPAASELPLGRGCVREVAIPVDAVGDVALRDSFHAIARSLLEPCGGERDFRLADVGALRSAGGVASREPSAEVREPLESRVPLLLALFALAVLVTEQLLRSRGRRAATA